MSFETFQQPFMDDSNDPGPYYVFENGQMKPPPGSRTEVPPLPPDEGEEQREQLLPHRLTYDQASKQHKAPKLLDICIDFIAVKVDLLDSLVDFPEIVGKTLFTSVIEHGKLDQLTPQSFRTFQVFQEAYGSEFLGSLCIQSQGTFARDSLRERPRLYTSLTKLDLSGCKLGWDKKSLTSLTQLCNILELNLCDNALRDHSVQQFTSPSRIFGHGPVHLQILSLACNPDLTDNCVHYLACFPHLEELDLSGSNISLIGKSLLNKSHGYSESASFKRLPNVSEDHLCRNCGWAADIVSKWVKSVAAAEEAKKTVAPPEGMSALGAGRSHIFYQKRSNRSRPLRKRIRPAYLPVIKLCRSGKILSASFPRGAYVKHADVKMKSIKSKHKKKLLTVQQIMDEIDEEESESHSSVSNMQLPCKRKISPSTDIENKDKKKMKSSRSNNKALEGPSRLFHSDDQTFGLDLDILQMYKKAGPGKLEQQSSLMSAMDSSKW